jgi:hypothetical protein
MTFQWAIRNVLKYPFKQEKSAASKKWLRYFLKRHPVLRMRNPESITSARVKGKARLLDIYGPELNTSNHQAHKIFSADETWITVAQQRHSKIASVRRKK